MPSIRRAGLLVAIALTTAAMIVAMTANASALAAGVTHTVTNANDAGAGSLRQAIADASDGDVVAFDLSTPATITLTSGQLVVDEAITLQGPGSELLAISANGAGRVITASRPITLAGLTLRDGNAPGDGGAVWAAHSLLLSDTAVISNASALHGGGVYAAGSITLTHCSLWGNVAGGAGGGAFGRDDVIATGCHVNDNASSGDGGGMRAAHTLEIYDSAILSNTSSSGLGGGIATSGRSFVDASDISYNVGAGHGGGVYAAGSVMMTDTHVAENATAGSGGGVYTGNDVNIAHCDIFTNSASGPGGGFYAGETADVTSSAISGNTSSDAGGGASVRTRATISNTTLALNAASDGGGARVDRLYLNASLVISNTASESGGGAWAKRGVISGTALVGNTTAKQGGGVWLNQPAQLYNVELRDNVANESGGALYTTDHITFVGGRVVSNTATLSGGGLYVGKNVALYETEIISNSSPGAGGGVCAIGEASLVDASVIANESGYRGGGVFAGGGATISRTSVMGNTSADDGGGIHATGHIQIALSQFAGNRGEFGGAVCASGKLDMTNSTIASTLSGGGLRVEGDTVARIVNCTITGNASGPAQSGGGIQAVATGPASGMYIVNCTVTGNESSMTGAGLFQFICPVWLTNTLVAGNTAGGPSDILAAIASGGGNLVGDSTGCTGLTAADQYGTSGSPLDARLGPLGDYGGETWTVPLLPGSPALDMGTGPGAPADDQRGVSRDTAPDVGAFESQGFWLSVASGSDQVALVGTPFGAPLVTRVNSHDGSLVAGAEVRLTAPMTGPSALLSPAGTIVVGEEGLASVTATANGSVGDYQVSATMQHASPAHFSLANRPDVSAEVSLSADPEAFCPSDVLRYRLLVTNTSPSTPLTDLALTGTLPISGCLYAGSSGPTQGTYDPGTQMISWSLPELGVGRSITVEWAAHTLMTLTDGQKLVGQSAFSSQWIPPITRTITATADTTLCPPDLIISGTVAVTETLGALGPSSGEPIQGATVAATACDRGIWSDATDALGAYHITVPGAALLHCHTVSLAATAPGYRGVTVTHAVADLRASPVRVIWLTKERGVYLPFIVR